MVSVVRRLRNTFIPAGITIIILGLAVLGPFQPSRAQDEQNIEEVTDASPISSFSLEGRLERPAQKIRFARKQPTPLVPTSIRINGHDAIVEDSYDPQLALVHGLIQKIKLDKDVYQQGEVATLNVTSVLPLEHPRIDFLYRTYRLYADPAREKTYQTILAVPMKADPGAYSMTLQYKEDGTLKELELPFEIIPGEFSEHDTADLDIHILTEETLEMLKYEGRYFGKAYSINPDTTYYEGDFIWPCAGTVTGLYGTPRRYNEDLDKWSHKAIDIANIIGTKVYATNHGVVVMTENLEVHGKSIVIAHGKHIHSVYIHLDDICVKKGDKVKKGQLIGKLGKTGLCTGPNLHWCMIVNYTATNPRFWLPGQPDVKKGMWVAPDRTTQ
jgi:murein DD-endopeptidase MepM/ murein hydrolase activator NlpD